MSDAGPVTTTRRRLASSLVAVVLACGIDVAHADVYGYVDDGGQVHLATEALDARYRLFMKSRDGTPALATPPAVDPALMRTKLFRRLVDHPNIARYEPLIRAAATARGLDPDLVKAVIAVESGFDPDAVSDKGAVGLMQVLPATGERYGVRADRKGSIEKKLTDPRLNIDVGTRYLADLLVLFATHTDLALAAYNAGENAVAGHRNAIPPYPETQAYVRLVDQFFAFYRPKPARGGDDDARIRVVLPGRRNLPDPTRARPVDASPAPPMPASADR